MPIPRPGPRSPTNRQMAAVALRAAGIIVGRGKATGTFEDARGQVCANRALLMARDELGYDATHIPILIADQCAEFDAVRPLGLMAWSDLPTTTEHDIAKVFLQFADDLGSR